jgi:putative ABC transport system permease protein
MRRIPGLRRLFQYPHRSRRQINGEIDDELAFHIDMVAAELVAAGVPASEARERAREQFGDVARARRVMRREEQGIERSRRRADLAGEIHQDLVFAARQLRRSPAFALVAVLTLGLGIGATTAIFSVVDGVLLRPLPYAEPDRLVRLRQVDGRTSEQDDTSPATFFDWRDRSRSFERVAFFQYFGHDVRGPSGETISLDSWLVSEDYFAVLGVQPRLGRVFLPDEFRTGAAPVVVISSALWKQRYGGDPVVLGRREMLDGVAHTIVGVMPPSFEFPEKRDLWAPKIFVDDEKQVRAGTYLGVVARLRPGVTMAAAQSDMDRVAKQLATEYPRTNAKVGVHVTSVPNDLVGPVRTAMLVLLGAVGCVLLVACANVANLLLARGADRRREFAIRAALGAGRARLMRQMVSENAMLAALGCGVGLVLGRLALIVLLALSPATLPRKDLIALDGRVLVFTLATSVVTALLFGLAPLRLLTRPDLHSAVRDGGRGTSASRGRLRLASTLIVTEVALALVLLVGSGLLIRSFVALLSVDPGFVPQRRAMVQVFLWDLYPRPELRSSFLREVLDRMAAVPGVKSAGAVSAMPFAAANIGVQTPIRFEGRPAPGPGESPNVYTTVATDGYFETMGVALRRGRTFAATDKASGAPVALISESLARHYFPDEDPIGKRIAVSFDGNRSREIVGIVADVRHDGLQAAPREEMYMPHAQFPFGSMTIVVRAAGDPEPLLPALQRAVWAVNRNQAIYAATTLDALVLSSLRERRFNLALIGSFATLALVLAAVGVYGLISYSTSRRSAEFGVRLALGASGRQIVAAAMRDGVRSAVIGTALGLAASYGLTRSMATMLFGVKPTDPLTFASLALVMLVVAALASYLPARRAQRVDPVAALRGDG